MGRGKTWDNTENEHLAKAWLSASEDPIVGTDQTRKVFKESVHRRFIEFAPGDKSLFEVRYGSRTAVSVTQHFSDLSADIQKFRSSLLEIRATDPTGTNEDGITSMAVALHIGEAKKRDYEYTSFDCTKWAGFKAWLILRHHPKWSELFNEKNEKVDVDITICEDKQSNNNYINDDDDDESNDTNNKKRRRFPIGIKSAKNS